jgi:hypothetical protein
VLHKENVDKLISITNPVKTNCKIWKDADGRGVVKAGKEMI